MTDDKILKLLGLSKDSPLSEMIVQPVHKCFALQEKVEELEASLLDVSKCAVEKVKKLEKQIENMKCCDNCALYQCEKWKSEEVNYHYSKCDKWELRS